MNIVNTAQAERWNTGDGVAHGVDNQARYDRMHVPPAGFGSGDGPGMFAFADPDRIRQVLAEAG